jgi:hypothetical protein
MHQRIWKYPLPEGGWDAGITHEMPRNAKILTAQVQHGVICLWAQVQPGQKDAQLRTFRVYGTGQPLPDNPGTYVATVQMRTGMLVFHVYEVTNAAP